MIKAAAPICKPYARFSPRPNAAECDSIPSQIALVRSTAIQRGYRVGDPCEAPDCHGAAGVFVEIKEKKTLLVGCRKCWGTGYDHTYADADYHGNDADRPAFWVAIESMKRGEVLMPRDHERLARDQLLAETAHAEVRKRRARIEYVFGESGEGPENTLLRQILQSIAEYKRKQTSILTKLGMRRNIKKLMRQSDINPYGFDTDPNNPAMMIENPAQQEVIATIIVPLNDAGYALRAIARELTARGIPTSQGAKEWGHNTVREILRRARQPV